MKKAIAIILVACLCLPLAFGGVVVAQSDGTDTTQDGQQPTEDEQTTNDSNDSSNTDSGSSDSDSDGQSAEETAKELWTLYVQSEDTNTPQQTTIQRQFGPTVYLLDHYWNQDEGTVRLTLRVTEQTDVTFTDSSGVFTQGVMKGAKRSMTLPAGTYNVLIPATTQESGYQAISIDPATEQFVFGLDTGDAVSGQSTFNKQTAIKYSFAGLVGLTILACLTVLAKFSRDNRNEKITNADGVELSGGKVYGKDMSYIDDSNKGD